MSPLRLPIPPRAHFVGTGGGLRSLTTMRPPRSRRGASACSATPARSGLGCRTLTDAGRWARLGCSQVPSNARPTRDELVAVAGACPGPRRYERRVRLIRHPAVELVHSVGIEPTSPRLQRGASTWLASSALWYGSCAPDSRRALVCTRDLRRCLRLRSRRTGIPARLCTASFGFGDRRAAVEHHGDVLGRAASVELAQPG